MTGGLYRIRNKLKRYRLPIETSLLNRLDVASVTADNTLHPQSFCRYITGIGGGGKTMKWNGVNGVFKEKQ